MSIVEQAHAHYEPGCPYEIPIPDTPLFELLNTTARLYPSHVALDYMGATTTYRQVLAQVLRAAQVLVDAGVRKGDVVAIALPNCPQAFVAFYACMRIGAVAAEHNPLAPAHEIEGQLKRHHAKVAIVWEKCVGSYPTDGSIDIEKVFTVNIAAGLPTIQRLALKLPVAKAKQMHDKMRGEVPDSTRSWDHAVAAAHSIRRDYPHPTGSDRAVILHTGGTNGIPKSVPLTHTNIGANVNQNLFWVWKLHEGAETFFSLLPYFHAFGLTFFLCASVRKAATQVLMPTFDAAMAVAAHRRRAVTFFVGVPAMFERILKEARKTHTPLDTIRYSVSGAMPLSTAFADEWEEYTGGIILEGYGLSETSPVICGSPLGPGRRHGTLGIPFASTELRLVDLEDPTRDVDDGEPGEIIVRGPQVFEGYLDAPDETAKVFTQDGWLRTGDIGVNDDGFITLADRRKELILSGGFNVYPSQVEDAIRSMPGVKDVAVVGLPKGDETEEVTAALIMDEGAPLISLDQVREWAERSISHYALPRQIAFISTMPRNQLGKVMRRKVREQLLNPAAKLWDSTSKAVEDAVTPVVKGVSEAATTLSRGVSDATEAAIRSYQEEQIRHDAAKRAADGQTDTGKKSSRD